MAKAQLENGYTKIAHELLEKICSMQLNTNEFRVFLAIARLSYGWRQKTTAERASGDALSEMTGLRRDKVYSAAKSLKKRAIITSQLNSSVNEYKINTEIEEWKDIPKSGAPNLGTPESGQIVYPSQVKNTPESGQIVYPSQVYATSATLVSEAGPQMPKDIKDIKDRKDRESLPSDFYQKALNALGLPATGILSPKDHQVLVELLKIGCTFEDIEAARIKRKKTRLEWIQDTVCEMRDARLATVAKVDHNGIPILPNGRMDWENMTYDQKTLAMELRYEA